MFKHKTVVVTGAGRGIGRTLALGFAEQGATVLVHYFQSKQGARDVVNQIQVQGGQAIMIQADIRQASEVTRLVTEAHRQLGPIDIWINNAGATANSEETQGMEDAAVFERLIEVDILGTWRCCREVRPYMRAGGCLLTTGWDGVLVGLPGLPNQAYAASKGAIMALTRSLAAEYAPDIRVNCIAPGLIENDWARRLSAQARQHLSEHVPLQRWGTPEDVLQMALFLASPAASYITGQTMLVNGGGIMH
jgi:NAD(P)-dependent dehydrogenase (short-subunit alcohol dehydrogenase family)